jgi:inositol 1,4,5-triphosphate receptor type 1
MWHYLYFIVLVRVKDPTEFTGPESYVYAMVKVSFQFIISFFLFNFLMF